MSSFIKQPGDVVDYDVDMADWFADIPGDDIQDVVVTVGSASEATPTLAVVLKVGKQYVLQGANPTSFKVWLAGGTSYTDYKVTCLVTTGQDRIKEVEFAIKVRDK